MQLDNIDNSNKEDYNMLDNILSYNVPHELFNNNNLNLNLLINDNEDLSYVMDNNDDDYDEINVIHNDNSNNIFPSDTYNDNVNIENVISNNNKNSAHITTTVNNNNNHDNKNATNNYNFSILLQENKSCITPVRLKHKNKNKNKCIVLPNIDDFLNQNAMGPSFNTNNNTRSSDLLITYNNSIIDELEANNINNNIISTNNDNLTIQSNNIADLSWFEIVKLAKYLKEPVNTLNHYATNDDIQYPNKNKMHDQPPLEYNPKKRTRIDHSIIDIASEQIIKRQKIVEYDNNDLIEYDNYSNVDNEITYDNNNNNNNITYDNDDYEEHSSFTSQSSMKMTKNMFELNQQQLNYIISFINETHITDENFSSFKDFNTSLYNSKTPNIKFIKSKLLNFLQKNNNNTNNIENTNPVPSLSSSSSSTSLVKFSDLVNNMNKKDLNLSLLSSKSSNMHLKSDSRLDSISQPAKNENVNPITADDDHKTSVPILFYCLLHLANENNLHLKQTEEFKDIVIDKM